MKTKVQRWGNSLAVGIPKTFAEKVGLKDDSPVEMSLVKGGLLLEPSSTGAPSLDELLDGVTDSTQKMTVHLHGLREPPQGRHGELIGKWPIFICPRMPARRAGELICIMRSTPVRPRARRSGRACLGLRNVATSSGSP